MMNGASKILKLDFNFDTVNSVMEYQNESNTLKRKYFTGDSINIECKLKDDTSIPLNLRGVKVSLIMLRKDNTFLKLKGSIVDPNVGLVHFILKSGENNVSGSVILQIVIEDMFDPDLQSYSQAKEIFIDNNIITNKIVQVQENILSIQKIIDDINVCKQNLDEYKLKVDQITLNDEYLEQLKELVKLIETNLENKK